MSIQSQRDQEDILWDRILLDLIEPHYPSTTREDDPFIPKYLSIIDHVTGWFKKIQYNDKQTDNLFNLVDQAWVCIYSIPTTITYSINK